MQRGTWAGLCLMAWTTWVSAADFAVHSTVYIGDDEHRSTTIFRAGRMYDLLEGEGEITIFDAPNGRFVILDPRQKVKTEVSTAQIDGFCQRMRSEALATNDPLTQFLAAPSFTEQLDASSGVLSLSNPRLDYVVRGSVPQDATMARQYAHFVQWQTKLNTVLRPGSLPPFARLALNTALEKQGWIPSEVQATRKDPTNPRRSVTLRSEHAVQGALVASEVARVDAADRYLATFTPLPLIEYQRRVLTAPTAGENP